MKCIPETATDWNEQQAALHLAATIVESSYDAITSQTPDGIILSWNKGAERIYGYTAEEMIGQSVSIIVPPDRLEEVQQLLHKVAQGVRVENYEMVFIRKDGSLVEVARTISPLRDASGMITGVSSISRDITEKKRAAAELQALNAKLEAAYQANQRIMDHSVDVICTVDAQGIFVQISAACEKTWGYTPEEMIGRSAFDLVYPEDLPSTQAIAQRIIAGEPITAFENRSTRKDGSLVPLIWSAAWSETDQAMFCVARDNTEPKRAEMRLRQAEGRLRAIMDNTPDVIYLKDRKYRFLMMNPQCESLFSTAPGQLIGKTDYDILPVELADAIRATDEKILRDGAVLKMEESTVDKHGRPHIYLSSKFPIYNEEGEIVAIAGISTEITERKQQEEALKTYTARLETNNRELQEFAFVASHDLQEPLRKIQAFGDRLNSKYAELLGDTGRDYLARMQNAAGRMQTLIEDLLALSRITTRVLPFTPVDLNQIMREVVSDLEVRFEGSGGHIEITELPTIEADALQMRQLFQNLIGNALKFHREGVAPEIKVSAEMPGTDEPPHGARCRLLVEDNGIGFEEEYLNRIFAPFQRLHGREEYEGTGIGLSICRKIVERHGGHITASSKPGEGSVFIVTMPLQGSERNAPI